MGREIRSVAIDPGHGGLDLGAVGPVLGINEKDVALALALDLGKLLERDGRRVVYTRDSDISVYTRRCDTQGTDIQELDVRCAIANKSDVDLLVSIHCNSSVQPVNGVEVFYYSERGKGFARAVQKNLVDLLGANNMGAKQGDFYLLARANMVAILVNAAFITNRREEEKLTNKMFLKKIVVSIAKAVIEKTL